MHTDYELAREIGRRGADFSGTDGFIAPEVLEAWSTGENLDNVLSTKYDVWSLAIILSQLLDGQMPEVAQRALGIGFDQDVGKQYLKWLKQEGFIASLPPPIPAPSSSSNIHQHVMYGLDQLRRSMLVASDYRADSVQVAERAGNLWKLLSDYASEFPDPYKHKH